MRTRIPIGVFLLTVGSAAAQAQLTELRPTDMGGYVEFGASVAAQGDLLLVGAPGENARAVSSGAVRVLRFALGTWVEEAVLVPDDGAAGDRFGTSVALDGERALVGAPERAGGAGAAYVFRREAGTWTQEALLASDGTDGLGRAVALHGDTALVVDPQGAAGTQSTVRVFRRDAGAWLPEAQLVPPGAVSGQRMFLALTEDTAFLALLDWFLPTLYAFVRDDQGTAAVQDDTWSLLGELPPSGLSFGGDLALAVSGDRLAVGLPGNPLAPGPGVVHVFERDDGGTPGEPLDDAWPEVAQIVDPAGSPSFGSGVALDGDLLLGCAPYEDPASVSLFRFDGTAWQAEATVLDLASGGNLGTAVALGDGLAFVSDDSDEHGPDTGSVRVIEDLVGGWTWTQELLPGGLIRVGCFGCAVDVAGGPGGAVLVGAQLAETAGEGAGAAYVFRRSPDGWLEETRLLPSGLAPGDRFGSAVALDREHALGGERALVGAHQRDGAFVDQGAAYVFRRAGDAWIQEAELVAPQPSLFGYFGSAVALAGDVALVGAFADDQAGGDAGAVFAFRFDGSAWALADVLRAADAAPGAHFGAALALEPGRALVGAPGANGSKGACYVFREEAGGWVQEARLAAPDGIALDYFGLACALSGGSALVGAPRADGVHVEMGAAYAFVRDPASGAWSLEQKLVATSLGGWHFDWYGTSVALQGDAALVGAPVGEYSDGKAFRLVRTPHAVDPWVEAAALQQEVCPLPYQKAGFAVALDLDTAVIGAPVSLHDLADWDFAGSAFVGTVALPLTAVPASLSAADGGTQTLQLDAPIADAGRVFVVLGSLSGTEPGLAFGAWTLPLNPDTYFKIVANEPDQAPASGFVGVLDDAGDAQASVMLAPGQAVGLQGTTAHHAFAVLDLGTGVVTFVSNAAPLALTP